MDPERQKLMDAILSPGIRRLTPEQERLIDVSIETKLREDKRKKFSSLCEAHNQPLILLDLDNTLCHFEFKGWDSYDPYDIPEPLQGAKETCLYLENLGTLGLITSRFSFWDYPPERREKSKTLLRDTIRSWLNVWGFPLMKIYSTELPHHAVFISDTNVQIESNLEEPHHLLRTLLFPNSTVQSIETLLRNYKEEAERCK